MDMENDSDRPNQPAQAAMPDNIIPFPLTARVKIERVARAMSGAENNGDESAWDAFIAEAIVALKLAGELLD